MGNCLTSSSDEAAKDLAISKRLANLNKGQRDVLKLLLLGTGDSGKTTIFKQMHYLYGSGFTVKNRTEMRKPIFATLIDGSKTILDFCGVLEGTEELNNKDTLKAAELLKNSESANITHLDNEIAEAIQVLWKDKSFQKTWDQRSKIQVTESYGVFAERLSNFPTWGGKDWIPEREDFLLARIRTTGVVEKEFDIGGVRFRLVDVGGQRNERRKWIHCFAGVTAVLFIAASSEYDQTLFEQQTKNRLIESLDLFGTMANSQWFSQTTMILFLNKADLLEEKLCVRKIPLNVTGDFPDAPDTFEVGEAVKWLEEKFFARLSANNRGQFFFTHLTTALDASNVKVVIEACKKTILKDTLRKLNFYP